VRQLQIWDVTLSTRFALAPTDARWPLAARIAHLGDGNWVFGGLIFVYMTGWLYDTPLLRVRMSVLLVALLATATIVFIIKYTLRRERPRDPTGFVTIRYDKYSFPSGHSARMSCLAMTILFFNSLMGFMFLLLALMVATARVLVGVHYLGDVVAGFAIGALTAVGVVQSWYMMA